MVSFEFASYRFTFGTYFLTKDISFIFFKDDCNSSDGECYSKDYVSMLLSLEESQIYAIKNCSSSDTLISFEGLQKLSQDTKNQELLNFLVLFPENLNSYKNDVLKLDFKSSCALIDVSPLYPKDFIESSANRSAIEATDITLDDTIKRKQSSADKEVRKRLYISTSTKKDTYQEPLIPNIIKSESDEIDPSGSISKTQFLSFFQHFYETQQENIKLQEELKQQIHKVSTLLHALSSSGQMIEGLVRANFREMQKECLEKVNMTLFDHNERISIIEKKSSRNICSLKTERH